MRSFALERDDGNLLVYGAETTPPLEGITRRYLGHWHEAMFAAGLDGTPTFVHERDREQSEQRDERSPARSPAPRRWATTSS